MDAPKCRLCGKKHWGQCRDPVATALPKAAVPAPPVERQEPVPAVEPEKMISTRNRERYRAYQREYQRKRRAAQKEQAT